MKKFLGSAFAFSSNSGSQLSALSTSQNIKKSNVIKAYCFHSSGRISI